MALHAARSESTGRVAPNHAILRIVQRELSGRFGLPLEIDDR